MREADTVAMDSIAIDGVTLRIDRDLLTVEADGCVRVERLVADREPHERIRDAVAELQDAAYYRMNARELHASDSTLRNVSSELTHEGG